MKNSLFAALATLLLAGTGETVATASPATPLAVTPLWSATSVGGGQYTYENYCAGQVTNVTDPDGSGASVIRMAVDDSCRPYSGATNPRADLHGPVFAKENTDLYFSDQVKIPYPAQLPQIADNGTSFLMLASLYGNPHGGSGATPQLEVQSFGGVNHFVAAFGTPRSDTIQWRGPVLDAQWHTVTFHVHVDGTGAGWTDVYWDGQLQTLKSGATRTSYQVLVNGNNWDGTATGGDYLQVSDYRAAGMLPGTFIVYHGYDAIGSTLDSVKAPGGWNAP